MQKRKNNGQYAVGTYKIVKVSYWTKIKRFFKKVLIGIVVLGVLFGIYKLGGLYSPSIEYRNKEVILDNLTEKINQLKGQLVEDIKKCESAGYDENAGLITFDPHKTNKSVAPASIGSYQWKVASVKYYYKSLYQKEITNKEAVLIALDDLKAGELTTDVIFKTKNGLDNWINCSRKNNSGSKLEIINNLTK